MPGMFEALETGKSIKGSDFTKLRDALRPQLERGTPIIGLESATLGLELVELTIQ